MKNILVGLFAFSVFSAYAQTGGVAPQDLREYMSTQKPLRDSGQLPASEYFKGLYSRLFALSAPGDVLERTNRMIRNAELYEAGSIDKSEYDYRWRTVQAEEVGARQAQQAAVEADARINAQSQQEQAQQRSSALMATAAQLLQASGPRTLTPTQMPAPVGLSSYLQSQSINGSLKYCRYGNGVVSTISIMQICPQSTQ